MSTNRADAPLVLPMRDRSERIYATLQHRLQTIMPKAMRAGGIDMWLLICQEDNLDPVYTTLIPMDTWCPILQILVLHDRGAEGVEGINISGTDCRGLYAWPYRGQEPAEQWRVLRQLIIERNPQRIGINIGSTQWAAGALTHNLYAQLLEVLPDPYRGRLVSAEEAATVWLATLTEMDVSNLADAVHVSKEMIRRCYSRDVIRPGLTTTADLEWYYWQTCADHGLDVSFKPFFSIRRRPSDSALHNPQTQVIRPGDLIHCDVGLRYLRMNTDHQQWAYVLRDGEREAPASLVHLLSDANRLQDVFMSEFQHGLTGNELLARILQRARAEGIPNPRVYSHSLGFCLHEPGPLIGLPWEQKDCGSRGEVKLDYGNAFTMELSVSEAVPDWDGAELRLSIEEDVIFTEEGCRLLGTRQTAFHLI